MRTAAICLALAYAAVIVVVLPVLGRARFSQLLKELESDEHAKIRFFRSTTVRKVLVTLPIAAIGLLASKGPSAIGLDLPGTGFPGLCIAAGLLGGTISGALRMRKRSDSFAQLLAKRPTLLTIIPSTRPEKVAFSGVAISAGVCEELIYRGFGIALIRWAWPSVGTAEICLMTAVAFGMVHAYQGKNGVVATGFIGFMFALVTIWTGSLLPAIVLHTLFDLRLLVIPSGTIAAARAIASGQSAMAKPQPRPHPHPQPHSQPSAPPGWYQDPSAPPPARQVRWWDGRQWSPHVAVRDAGVSGVEKGEGQSVARRRSQNGP